jgi:S1-C subfamily serine protease
MGVTSAIASPNGASAGIGFAIPASIVAKVVPALIQDGHYDHTYLGMSGTNLTPDAAAAMNLKEGQRGALVVEVQSGSPADQAGVRGGTRTAELDGVPLRIGGDVITRIGDQEVRRFDDIVAYLARSTSVGQEVTIALLREGREMTVKVTLEARPGQPQQPDRVAAAATDGRAWLGLQGADLSPQMAVQMGLERGQTGVLVGSVIYGSPADQAGLRGSDKRALIDGKNVELGGDVITAVDGKPLRSMRQLQQVIANHKVGDTLKLTVLRGGKEIGTEVTLAAPQQP